MPVEGAVRQDQEPAEEAAILAGELREGARWGSAGLSGHDQSQVSFFSLRWGCL